MMFPKRFSLRSLGCGFLAFGVGWLGACAGESGASVPASGSGETALLPSPLDAGTHALAATQDWPVELVQQGSAYEFRVASPHPVTFRIDTQHPDALRGLLRVEELHSGSIPVDGAGFLFREDSGEIRNPQWLSQQAQVSTVAQVDGSSLRIEVRYTMPVSQGGRILEGAFELSVQGKALAVRVWDRDESLEADSSFAGVHLGSESQVAYAQDLRLPYMIAYPVTLFSTSMGERRFLAKGVDWSRSHGTVPPDPQFEDVEIDGDRVDRNQRIDYVPHSGGELNAPVEETFWVVVSDQVEDTFVDTAAQPSPYWSVMAERTSVLFSRRTPWEEQRELLDLLDLWGLEQLAVYDFWWWSNQLHLFEEQVQTHQWVPAYDEGEFIAYAGRARELGYLFGVYTLYGINRMFPNHDVTDGVLDWTGDRLVRISPDRVLGHSLREDTAIRSLYGTSLAFTDVWGHEHPGVVVDHEDGQDDKAKTIRSALIEKRRVFRQMQDLHAGPVLSEGSGALFEPARQHEILHAGFVDSNQGSLNTGAQQDLQSLDPESGKTPERWWVMPDYAQRVKRRVLVDHGLGFYDRFFHSAQTPLATELLDKYRLYELTYGCASFIQTTGPVNGTEMGQPNNRLYFADHIKEYYLMQGFQEERLKSPVHSIHYWTGDRYQTANERLRESRNPLGALEDFRDPKIRIVLASGLVLYLNHSSEDWEVTYQGDRFLLGEDGWFAGSPSTGAISFSGIPLDAQGPAGQHRIDYALVPGQWELLDGRGVVAGYQGLANPNEEKRLYVRNEVRGITLEETVRHRILVHQGAAQACVALTLSGPSSFPVGSYARLPVRAEYSGGAKRPFSALLGQWSSSDRAVARVNQAGVVEALSTGNAQIRFDPQGLPFSATWTVRVP